MYVLYTYHVHVCMCKLPHTQHVNIRYDAGEVGVGVRRFGSVGFSWEPRGRGWEEGRGRKKTLRCVVHW